MGDYELRAITSLLVEDLRDQMTRLRGSFVSLHLWAGEDLTYVAAQAGHSVATLARHYAGVIKELHGQAKIPAAEAIRQARERISCTADVRHAEEA